jgi:hypothetical protein
MADRNDSNSLPPPPPASPRQRRANQCPPWLRLHNCQTLLLNSSESLIHSLLWKVIIVIFTIVLLFGSPVQSLWVPKEHDGIFDLLYIVGLGVFSFDIVVHFLIDPEYFRFNPPRIFYWFLCCCCFGCCFRGSDNNNNKKETEDTTQANNKRGKRKGDGNDPSEKTANNTKISSGGGKGGAGGTKKNRSIFSSDNGIFGIGSFEFWCDVVSTAMFIYDISYFNRTNKKVLEMKIVLNEYGVPVRLFTCVLCWWGLVFGQQCVRCS